MDAGVQLDRFQPVGLRIPDRGLRSLRRLAECQNACYRHAIIGLLICFIWRTTPELRGNRHHAGERGPARPTRSAHQRRRASIGGSGSQLTLNRCGHLFLIALRRRQEQLPDRPTIKPACLRMQQVGAWTIPAPDFAVAIQPSFQLPYQPGLGQCRDFQYCGNQRERLQRLRESRRPLWNSSCGGTQLTINWATFSPTS